MTGIPDFNPTYNKVSYGGNKRTPGSLKWTLFVCSDHLIIRGRGLGRVVQVWKKLYDERWGVLKTIYDCMFACRGLRKGPLDIRKRFLFLRL